MPRKATAQSRLSPLAVAREAATTLRDHWQPLLAVALVVFAPIALLEAATEGLGETEEPGGLEIAEVLVAALAVSATATLGEVFYTGAVAALVQMRHGGTRRDIAQVARSLPYGTLIAVDLLFAAVVLVGLVLLIVPGLVFLTWYALAPAVVEFEGAGVRQAFRRSRELVRGSFWRVLVLILPVTIAGEVLGEWLSEQGPWLLGDGFFGDALGFLLASLAASPIYALAVVVSARQLIAHKGPQGATSSGMLTNR